MVLSPCDQRTSGDGVNWCSCAEVALHAEKREGHWLTIVQLLLCGKHRNGHLNKHKGDADLASVPPRELQAHSLTHDTLGTAYPSQAPRLPRLSELVLTGRSKVLNCTLETFLILMASQLILCILCTGPGARPPPLCPLLSPQLRLLRTLCLCQPLSPRSPSLLVCLDNSPLDLSAVGAFHGSFSWIPITSSAANLHMVPVLCSVAQCHAQSPSLCVIAYLCF